MICINNIINFSYIRPIKVLHIVILAICLPLFSSILYAESFDIKGKVVSANDNLPLKYANISVKSSNKGTIANLSGEFQLDNLKKTDTLLISYVGYEKQIYVVANINNKNGLIVYMKPSSMTSQTILVEGTVGETKKSISAYSILKKTDIEARVSSQDIPELLSYSPSTTFYTESGSSIGYSYLSIRGFDQRRISISVNGVPQNDPEDHNVYWIDFPNLIESAELVQVQRGSGSGIVGYPAIGGTVNIITGGLSNKPIYEAGITYASNNFRKYDITLASGLIDNKYSFYAKLVQNNTSGYREKSWADYKSFYLSAGRFDEDFSTQINIYGGLIEGGLNYTGISKDAIKDKDLRKKNYSWWEWDYENGRFAEWSTVRRDDEKEYFFQPHIDLINEWQVNDKLKINSTFFSVAGDGYFDYDGSWSSSYDDYFRLKYNGFSDSSLSNALIRAWVTNHQYGWNGSCSWEHENGRLIGGTSIRKHRSLHWGAIQYAEGLDKGIDMNYRYYQYEGGVDMLNLFLNENYNITNKLSATAELQLAMSKYEIFNEKYLDNEFAVQHAFLNYKFGANYSINENLTSFMSFARVGHEPRLKSYYDAAESSGGATPQFEYENGKYNFNKPLIQPEVMNDFEIGATFSNSNWTLSLNGYYMLFNDEIVKEGQLDRFGQPITGNIDNSTHIGIEFTSELKIINNLNILFNGSYGSNYISEGIKYLSWNDSTLAINMKNLPIGGFPNFLFNSIIKYDLLGFNSMIEIKYLGSYYSNNFGDEFDNLNSKYEGLFNYKDNKVEPYILVNFQLGYQLNSDNYKDNALQKVRLYGKINNIFNKKYAVYAIGNEFFPSNELNFIVGIEIGL